MSIVPEIIMWVIGGLVTIILSMIMWLWKTRNDTVKAKLEGKLEEIKSSTQDIKKIVEKFVDKTDNNTGRIIRIETSHNDLKKDLDNAFRHLRKIDDDIIDIRKELSKKS